VIALTIRPGITNARLIRDLNDSQKLWEMPNGIFILTSFSVKTEPKETAAFIADPNGNAIDWIECGMVYSEEPKHEEVIEDVLGEYNLLEAPDP